MLTFSPSLALSSCMLQVQVADRGLADLELLVERLVGLDPLEVEPVEVEPRLRELVPLGVERLLGGEEGLLGDQAVVEQGLLGVQALAQQGDVLLQRLDGALEVGPLLRQVAGPQPLLLVGDPRPPRRTGTAGPLCFERSSAIWRRRALCWIFATGCPFSITSPTPTRTSWTWPAALATRSETPPCRSRIPVPCASVGIEPKIPQPIAASRRAPIPARRQPPLGIGDLHHLVELLGRGEPLQGHLAEDHGAPSRRAGSGGQARGIDLSHPVALGAAAQQGAGLEPEVEQRQGEGELGRDLRLPGRDQPVPLGDQIEQRRRAPLELLLLVGDRPLVQPLRLARARSSWKASRPTASSAAGTSAPIPLARRSTSRAFCRRVASTCRRAPRARPVERGPRQGQGDRGAGARDVAIERREDSRGCRHPP